VRGVFTSACDLGHKLMEPSGLFQNGNAIQMEVLRCVSPRVGILTDSVQHAIICALSLTFAFKLSRKSEVTNLLIQLGVCTRTPSHVRERIDCKLIGSRATESCSKRNVLGEAYAKGYQLCHN
jgi:hypothetical protein